MDSIKKRIQTIPNWPKQGVMFRDFTSLIKDPQGLQDLTNEMIKRYKEMDIDYIVGIESRGFIHGAILAQQLGIGFIPIRKKGKLPPVTVAQEYSLEYGTDVIEIREEALNKGDKVLLVDDLIATGGTAVAAVKLLKKVGADIVECSFIIDLPDLGGKEKLEKEGVKAHAFVEFEGD